MNDRGRREKGFDRLAPVYDLGSRLFFGRSLLRSQTFFLNELTRPQTVLILGGGTGRILIELERTHPGARIWYVDISEKMLERAGRLFKQQFPDRPGSVEFICGSAETIPEACSFDLILTPYVLDCIPQAELLPLMSRLNAKLKPEGRWIFADFNVPRQAAMAFFSRLTIRLLYLFFTLVCGLGIRKLPDFAGAFAALHLVREKEAFFLGGMLTAKVYRRK